MADSNSKKRVDLLANLRNWRKSVDAQMPTLNPNYNKSSVAPKPNRRSGQATKPVSTPLGLVSASSYQVGNPPESALDGNAGTRWAASGEAVVA